jgi:tripartite-type tricarboxylate transporter receptor subunit TctC
MKLPRRNFLHLAAGAAALPATSRIARAQAYPARAVRVIVPFPPGGLTDVFARLAAQKLTEHFGRQFYVENISGRRRGARPTATPSCSPTPRMS